MATITKRPTQDGKFIFHVRVRLKGHPLQCASFERKTDAQKYIQQAEAAIREGRHFKTSASKRHTLGELVDRYIRDVLPRKPKSEYTQTIQLNWWKQELGSYLLADVTSSLISEMRDKLTSEVREIKNRDGSKRLHKKGFATANRYLAALSHAFTIAVKEWCWTETNPVLNVSKLKESRGRVRFLSDDERKALLIACKESQNPYLYPIVVLALSTGARKMEILTVTWEQVDLQRNVITIEETKNGERKLLPLTGLAHQLMSELNKTPHNKIDLVFPGRKKKPIELKRSWETALKKVQVEDFRFHDLRHSAASYLAMNGATLAEIAEVLGHKTLQMVKRYAHLSEAHTAKIVADMNQKIFG